MRVFIDDSTPNSTDVDYDKWSFISSVDSWKWQRVDGVTTILAAPGNALSFFAYTAKLVNSELLVTGLKMLTTNGQRYRFALRSDGSTSSETLTNALVARWQQDGTVLITKNVAGVATTLGTVTGKSQSKTWDLKFRAWSGQIQFRMWESGTAEPTTWDYEGADDGTVPRGVPAISAFRSGSTGGLQLTSIEASSDTPGIRPTPYIYPRAEGGFHPYGKAITKLVDDSFLPQPAWLTGSTTLDSRPARVISAGAGAVASVSGPAITSENVEAIWWTVNSVALSADTDIQPRLTIDTAASKYVIKPVGNQYQLAVEGTGAQSVALVPFWLGGGEGPKQRNLGLLLLPRYRQIIAMQGDQVLGWLDLLAAPVGAATPTLTVTGSVARSLNYRQLELVIETM